MFPNTQMASMGLSAKKELPHGALRVQTKTSQHRLSRYESDEEEISEAELESQNPSLSPVENDSDSVSTGDDASQEDSDSLTLCENESSDDQVAPLSEVDNSPRPQSVNTIRHGSTSALQPKASCQSDDCYEEDDDMTAPSTPSTNPPSPSPLLLPQPIFLPSEVSDSVRVSIYQSGYYDPFPSEDALDMEGEVMEAKQIKYRIPQTRPNLISIGQLGNSTFRAHEKALRSATRKSTQSSTSVRVTGVHRLGTSHRKKESPWSSVSTDRHPNALSVHVGNQPREEGSYLTRPFDPPSRAGRHWERDTSIRRAKSKPDHSKRGRSQEDDHDAFVKSGKRRSFARDEELGQKAKVTHSRSAEFALMPLLTIAKSSFTPSTRPLTPSSDRQSVTEPPQSTNEVGGNPVDPVPGSRSEPLVSVESQSVKSMLLSRPKPESEKKPSLRPAKPTPFLSSHHTGISPTDGFLSTEIYQSPFTPRSRSGSVHSEMSSHSRENPPSSPYIARLKLSSAMNRVTSSLAVEVVSLAEGSENGSKPRSKPKKHHMRTGIWDEGVGRAVGKGLMGLGLGRKKRSTPSSDP
ncbi:hypothetical protein V8E54_003975 [Elaphomyces granulatus]